LYEEEDEEEDDVFVKEGRQVLSPAGRPERHLQEIEHGCPFTPFLAPSLHSSPSEGSKIPFPQPAGVAPVLMIYGRPMDPRIEALN
jgi:hypothetical protein